MVQNCVWCCLTLLSRNAIHIRSRLWTAGEKDEEEKQWISGKHLPLLNTGTVPGTFGEPFPPQELKSRVCFLPQNVPGEVAAPSKGSGRLWWQLWC